MNKKIRILVLILVVFVLCGCQPTPENEIVISKNDGELERIIYSETAESVSIETDNRWIEEFSSIDEKVTISIDAPIIVPPVVNVPVVSVWPHVFNNDEISLIVKELYGDEKLYENTMTTDELARVIIAFRADLESLKKDGKYSELHLGSGAGELVEDVDDAIYLCKQDLKELEEDYANAVKGLDAITDIIMDVDENNNMSLNLRNDEDLPATFGVFVSSSTNSCALEYRDWNGSIYSKTRVLDEDEELDLIITKQEAQNTAIDFLYSIGLTGISIISTDVAIANENLNCYNIVFGRSISGVPCFMVPEYKGTLAFGVDGEEYREPWNDERIEVMVNETGIIGFRWDNPSEMGEIINENVSILPFEKIKSNAVNLLKNTLAEQDFEIITEAERYVIITEIKFGMMRIAKKDTENEYYYFPVWDFMGSYGDKSGENTEKSISFLTVNAIDGSRIDRGLGY